MIMASYGAIGHDDGICDNGGGQWLRVGGSGGGGAMAC